MNIIIANTPIRENAAGLFCLNDLHHAAGGEPRHRPSRWLDTQQTKEFLGELQTAGIPAVVSTEGRNGGTFGVHEAVYAYATWISPKFFLKVIRVFHATVTGQSPALPAPAAGNLALAQEIGALRDDFRAMQQEFVGVLKSHVKTSEKCARLQGQVARLKEAAATRSRIDSAVAMLAAKRPRAEIEAVLGITNNYLRQIAKRARDAGRLRAEDADQMDLALA